jgi:hypothetical protein
MPITYIASGGFTGPNIMPEFSYGLFRAFECTMKPLMNYCAMFAHIVFERRAENSDG